MILITYANGNQMKANGQKVRETELFYIIHIESETAGVYEYALEKGQTILSVENIGEEDTHGRTEHTGEEHTGAYS